MVRADATSKSKFIKATKSLHQTVTQAFAQEANASRTPFYERERYAAALMAIGGYFTSLEGRPIGQRFFELGSAMADLNSGIVHPLLRPARADNRPADPSQLWRARAHVALGLEALLRSGLNRLDAAAKVPRQYSSIASLAGPKAKDSTLETTLFGWRREFKAGRVKNFEASELFAEGIRRIDRLSSRQAYLSFAARQFGEAAVFSCVLSPSS